MTEILQPAVEKFVEDQRGFYHPHMSDAALVALLMWRLSGPFRHLHPGKSLAQALLEGDHNAAYEASCCVFERILEHGAKAGGNGHHRAQAFAAAMHEALEFAPYPPIRTVEEFKQSYNLWTGATQISTSSDDREQIARAHAVCYREEQKWEECRRFFDFDADGNIIGLKSDREGPIRSAAEFKRSFDLRTAATQVANTSEDSEEVARANAVCVREAKRQEECSRFFNFDSEGYVVDLKSETDTPEVAETPEPVKGKYDGVNPLDKLHPGEPYFFLRAQDLIAPNAVLSYAHSLKTDGDAKGHDECTEVARRMLQWQRKFPDKVKMPDGVTP